MTDPQILVDKVLTHPVDKVHTHPKFVANKRVGNDLDTLAAKYPDGAPDHIIASALLVSEEDVEQIWKNAVERLRGLLNGRARVAKQLKK